MKALFNPQYGAAEVASSLTANIAVGTAVKETTNFLEVTPVTAATDLAIGFVSRYEGVPGQGVEIYREGGEAHGLAGGSITKGNALKLNASGQLVAASSGDKSIGYAREGGDSGKIISFYFTRFTA